MKVNKNNMQKIKKKLFRIFGLCLFPLELLKMKSQNVDYTPVAVESEPYFEQVGIPYETTDLEKSECSNAVVVQLGSGSLLNMVSSFDEEVILANSNSRGSSIIPGAESFASKPQLPRPGRPPSKSGRNGHFKPSRHRVTPKIQPPPTGVKVPDPVESTSKTSASKVKAKRSKLSKARVEDKNSKR